MGTAVEHSLRERLEGRWQVPAFLLASLLLAGSVWHFRTTRKVPSFEPRLRQLAARVKGGFYTSALDYGTRLLSDQRLPRRQRGEIHLQLARARYQRAEREKRTGPFSAEQVQEAYAKAEQLQAELSKRDLTWLAKTFVWQKAYGSALAYYAQAVERYGDPAHLSPADRAEALAAQSRVIELGMRQADPDPEGLLLLVDRFIAGAGNDAEMLYWAVAEKVDLLGALGRQEEALTFLDMIYPRFVGGPREDAHEYLVALVLSRLGRYEEAEGRLRALRNRIPPWDELYAQTGWLLGRVVLFDGEPGRPVEALSFFKDAAEAAPHSVYAVACRIGMGEALAELERYVESLRAYRRAIEDLGRFSSSAVLSKDSVRTSLTAVGERLRQRGQVEPALQYYELAAALVERRNEERRAVYLSVLGDLRAALGGELRKRAAKLSAEGEEGARRKGLWAEALARYGDAGEAFLELASLSQLNEEQSARALWRAADMFDEAGDPERTLHTLDQFLRDYPRDELIPRVLLRLGQARQAAGQYAQAIDAYQENLRRFPRTPNAGSGLLPLAHCYIALGGKENYQLAEKTLVDHILNDSPVFTPQAPEFRDALFLLGELHSLEGRLEDSIAVLEEALERYPRDPRRVRATLLLANGYRRSAAVLKDEIGDTRKAAEWPRMRGERRKRLQRAAELFGELVQAFEARGEDGLDQAGRLYLKQARLYQADCLFDLGRFREAVALYEKVAFIYRRDPAALSAYVQVINCRVHLGQLPEARAALRRARYLLEILPKGALADSGTGQSRADWQAYLDWLEHTELLGGKPS